MRAGGNLNSQAWVITCESRKRLKNPQLHVGERLREQPAAEPPTRVRTSPGGGDKKRPIWRGLRSRVTASPSWGFRAPRIPARLPCVTTRPPKPPPATTHLWQEMRNGKGDRRAGNTSLEAPPIPAARKWTMNTDKEMGDDERGLRRPHPARLLSTTPPPPLPPPCLGDRTRSPG